MQQKGKRRAVLVPVPVPRSPSFCHAEVRPFHLDRSAPPRGRCGREGYEVLEHRYRFHRHDVDLVARRGATVVFVEVKVRTGASHGGAAEAVTARKRLELTRAASAWLQRHGRPEDGARFDVIAVDADRVEWLQSAFRPGWR